MSDLYYRGSRIASNTTLFELHEEWKKTDPNSKVEVEVVVEGSNKPQKKWVNAKALAKEKLDRHFDDLDAEFVKHYPNFKPYP